MSQQTSFIEPAFGNISLQYVRASKTNPRKRFDETSLQELADSIKQHGVAQPILVRPMRDTEEPDLVEIVAGERRFRASQLAGATTIPAIVRDLTDAEVLEIQVIENLQRRDVHPMEEADGYGRLMDEHGYTADQLAEKVGKSRSYIYGKLKLRALSDACRDAFYEDKVSASVALLVARIPVAALQEEALAEIVKNYGRDEPMSYRDAARFVQQRYMLDLDDAPFPIHDLKLVAGAGACEACPKRAGNQPILFPDVGANVCTDPDCFSEKKLAHAERLLADGKRKGIQILEEKDSHAVMWSSENAPHSARMYKFERLADESNEGKTLAQLLTPEQLPKAKALVKHRDGTVEPVYEKTAVQLALEKAGLCLTIEQHEADLRSQTSGKNDHMRGQKAHLPKPDPELEARKQKAEAETKFRLALLNETRSVLLNTGAGEAGLPVFLRMVATYLSRDIYDIADEIGDRYDFNLNNYDQCAAWIKGASADQLLGFVVDICSPGISISEWDVRSDDYLEDEDYTNLVRTAEACGIDAGAMRAAMIPAISPQGQVPEEDQTTPPAEEKPAKRKAATKAKKAAQTPSEPAVQVETPTAPEKPASAPKKAGAVPVKYRNPETGDTWTGRGKAPKWIEGKDKEQFSILNPAPVWPWPKSPEGKAAPKQAGADE